MKKFLWSMVLISSLLSACARGIPTAPSVPEARPSPTTEATSTRLPATPTSSPVPPSETPAPPAAATPTSAESLFPTITFSQNAVCRLGPDPQYYAVTRFTTGQSSQVQARTEDGKWLNILSNTSNKSYTCWTPVTAIQPLASIDHLLVSIPPTLPDGPTWARSSKGVCGINRTGAIEVTWGPTVSGTGYYVLRNRKNIATVYGDSYIDHDTPGSKSPYVYTYVIQAFNSAGLARVVASVSVTLCD